MGIKEKFYNIEEALGAYILTGWTSLGAGAAVEMAAIKTTYLRDLYLLGVVPALVIGGFLYLHANLRNSKGRHKFIGDRSLLEKIFHE